MNALVTYKLTKRLQKDLVNLIFWRGAVICFIYQTIFAVVVCWACASVISKLYQFFSEKGVVDVWYHIFVSLPMALISASVLVKLVAQATRDKRGYSMAIKESWPLREDYAIEVEIRIDDNGIGLGKGFKEPKQIEWAEMIFAFASKDFYVFMDKGRGLVGIPKYAIDAALDRYLADQMKTIKKKRRLGVGKGQQFRRFRFAARSPRSSRQVALSSDTLSPVPDPLGVQFGRVGGGTQAYVDAGAEGEVSITHVF